MEPQTRIVIRQVHPDGRTEEWSQDLEQDTPFVGIRLRDFLLDFPMGHMWGTVTVEITHPGRLRY